MDRTPDVPDASPQQQFADWVDRVIKHFKATQGWSVRRVVAASGVSRSNVYRWLDADAPKGPDKATVMRFCLNLELDLDEPFAFFGWDPAGPGVPAKPDPLPIPPMGEGFRELVSIRYETPDLTDEEAADLDDQIYLWVQIYRRRRQRRRGETNSDGKRVTGLFSLNRTDYATLV
jgi:transcriptional regulator with XRE-family HTH domain